MKTILGLASLLLLLLVTGCEGPAVYGGSYGGVYGEYPYTYGETYSYPRTYVYPYPYYARPYDRDHYWDRDRRWERNRWHGDYGWGRHERREHGDWR